MKLKDVKRGEFFTRKLVEEPKESQVWIRGDYCRDLKKYECQNFNDANRFIYIRGDEEVFTDFTF